MNSPFVRTALITGAAIAVLNIVFVSLRYGLANVPLWFFGVQLLLPPTMILALQLFSRASVTRDFMTRAALYAGGWASPYLIYNLSSEMLRPDFNLQRALVGTVGFIVIFALVFATIRRPQG